MKRKRITEQNQLRRSWIMSLCNTLVYRDMMPRSTAMQCAFTAWDVLENLGRGVVEFAYYKMDGSVRRARGTLCRGVSTGFDSYQGKGVERIRRDNSNTEGIYTYWDLDRNGFRTFKAAKLKPFNAD